MFFNILYSEGKGCVKSTVNVVFYDKTKKIIFIIQLFYSLYYCGLNKVLYF